MCGITALLLADHNLMASIELHEGLGMLQHRGQDAAGIVTCGNKGRLYQVKGNGMVRDVFDQQKLEQLVGSMGVGHVRYPTAGSSSTSEAQPFYVNSPYGIVFAHNGNLVNADELRVFMDQNAHRHINTDSDSELLLNIFANNLQKTGKFRINEEDIFTAIKGIFDVCHGGYACVAMIAGFGIIGFRDPHGIRPIGFAKRSSPKGTDYMFASESVVCDGCSFMDFEDLKPGEAVIVNKNMQALADEVLKRLGPDMDVDVIIPVPDTSRVAALQTAYKLDITYREGFIKNRYIGRTFIMPGQAMRKKTVRRKFNAMSLEFAGKNVLIVDDSIVRGTTSKEIVQMARDAGAKKVYLASCAPAIRYPNVYGIDMPSPHELVAYNKNEDDIAVALGADKVIFQNLDGLIASCKKFNPSITSWDASVFDGKYISGKVDGAYLDHLARLRADGNKSSFEDMQSPETLGLYNFNLQLK
ncbi:amidophosphoribosyltransferase [Lunasporangiospora selenospora]|uniref:Amidophosphoribosyltransferase n=1 Tax=Lunasporangiospora selenospora TaxID=979761 RepID=A0A9P6KH11_9FUNG|nr:amidophosphoribosyltransferase [Lunasporangiospora selenospora]